HVEGSFCRLPVRKSPSRSAFSTIAVAPRPLPRRMPERALLHQFERCSANDEAWRRDYNDVRPHRSLVYRTPAEFLRLPSSNVGLRASGASAATPPQLETTGWSSASTNPGPHFEWSSVREHVTLLAKVDFS